MSASTLDRLRAITHDAGVAAGDVVTDVSSAALDALAAVDVERIAALPGALVGVTGVSSARARRLRTRRIVIGASLIIAAGCVAAVIVRLRRRSDSRSESDLDARREVRMAG
jgi:hypothetical protein